MITRGTFLIEFEAQVKIQRDYLRDQYPLRHRHHTAVLRRFDARADALRKYLRWTVWIPFKPAIRHRLQRLVEINNPPVLNCGVVEKTDVGARLYLDSALFRIGTKFGVNDEARM